AALVQQRRRGRNLHAIERGMERPLALQRFAAPIARIEMRFYPLLFVERKLAIKQQRKLLANRLAILHRKSPKAARIFCVARNRQFFAASSVVPSTSPIRRRRSP